MKEKQIVTSLIGKEEEFRILELVRTLNVPLLLIGKPGVSKTSVVLDYFKSIQPQANQEEIFILETDDSTPNSAVKGLVDLEKLFTCNKYETVAPITQANCILINEIDKASSMVRNSLLGIMNERTLYAGKEKISCSWELFIATCNQIPRSERQSPFFDRFIIKHEVNAINGQRMMEYFRNGGRKFHQKILITSGDNESRELVNIPEEKLKTFVDMFIDTITNRKMTYVPEVVKAISCIWKCNVDRALIKCAELMISQEAAVELSKALYSEEELAILSKIDFALLQTSTKARKKIELEIDEAIRSYQTKGRPAFLEEVENLMHRVISCQVGSSIPSIAAINSSLKKKYA